MGCLTGIFASPVNFGYWVRDNGAKGIIVLAVVLIAIMSVVYIVASAVIESMNPYQPTMEEQAGFIPPPRADAPYVVTTGTRIYYALIAIVNDDDTVTMTDYYEWVSGEWLKHTGCFVLDKNFGVVTVEKRRLGE